MTASRLDHERKACIEYLASVYLEPASFLRVALLALRWADMLPFDAIVGRDLLKYLTVVYDGPRDSCSLTLGDLAAAVGVRYGIHFNRDDAPLAAVATKSSDGTWQVEYASAGNPAAMLTEEEQAAITTARAALRRIAGG